MQSFNTNRNMINKCSFDYKGKKEKLLSLVKAEGKRQHNHAEKLPRLMSVSNHCGKDKMQGVTSLFAVPIADNMTLKRLCNGGGQRKQHRKELLDLESESYDKKDKTTYENILNSTGANDQLRKEFIPLRSRPSRGKTLSRQENSEVHVRPLRGKGNRTLKCVMSRETVAKEEEKLDEDYQHFDLRLLDLYMEDGDTNNICAVKAPRTTMKQRKTLPRKVTKQVKENFINAIVQENQVKHLQPIVSTKCKVRRRYVDDLNVDLTTPLLREYCRIRKKESEILLDMKGNDHLQAIPPTCK